MAKLRIKKGDTVQVIAGPAKSKGGYRGEKGKVIAVYPETKKRTRVGIRVETVERDGRTKRVRIRVAKRSGKDI